MNFKRFGLGIVTFVVGVILMVSGSSSEPTPQQAMNSDDTASAEAEDEKTPDEVEESYASVGDVFVVDDIEMRLENLAVYDGEINMHSERENDYMYLIEFNVNNQSDDSIPFSNSDLKAYDEEGYQLERILVSSNNNAGLDTINTMGALDAGRQIKLYVVLDAKTGEDIEVTWDKTVSFRSEKAEFVLPALQ